MKITLQGVSKGPALAATTVRFRSGKATLVEAETEQRPSVLGLIASGRMRPESGTVTIDGVIDNRALRAAVAIIDAPAVNEPASNVSLAGVVAEELMFAGLSAGPRAVSAKLRELGVSEFATWSMSTVSPGIRIRVLAELALLRAGVEGLVIVSPDRHGGHPDEWWGTAREIAARGVAVLVIAGHPSVVALKKKAHS